jgi:hypothetical protein
VPCQIGIRAPDPICHLDCLRLTVAHWWLGIAPQGAKVVAADTATTAGQLSMAHAASAQAPVSGPGHSLNYGPGSVPAVHRTVTTVGGGGLARTSSTAAPRRIVKLSTRLPGGDAPSVAGAGPATSVAAQANATQAMPGVPMPKWPANWQVCAGVRVRCEP